MFITTTTIKTINFIILDSFNNINEINPGSKSLNLNEYKTKNLKRPQLAAEFVIIIIAPI